MYKNLDIKVLYATFELEDIEECYCKGLCTGNSILALSAMEELRDRAATDIVVERLLDALESGFIDTKSVFGITLTNFLAEANSRDFPELYRLSRLFKSCDTTAEIVSVYKRQRNAMAKATRFNCSSR